MMQIPEKYIVNINEDGTKTVFNIETQDFIEMNRTCTIIFDYYDQPNEEIAKLIAKEFNVENEQIIEDIKDIKNQLEAAFLL